MITQSTINLVKKFEGVRYKAYQDVIGKYTTGVGHLILPSEKNLLTKQLTEAEVDILLSKDLMHAQACIQQNVRLNRLTQNQFDALASFIFNLGCSAFSNSTLLKKINGLDSKETITIQWLKWNKAGGVIRPGLATRRQAEVNLYFS
tara:strand:+ start:82 stop:522 length:441 start_codon:yes stop_codon:yes gene_type:complete